MCLMMTHLQECISHFYAQVDLGSRGELGFVHRPALIQWRHDHSIVIDFSREPFIHGGPPIAQGTKPIIPTVVSLFNSWLANAIPGLTPHTLDLVTSMSACRGSFASTQEKLDAYLSIDGLDMHSGGIT
nr:hypothetical protein CR513_38984 [Ipomoea trifida]